MFRYEKVCHGCEKQCKLHSDGYWHFPQINDITFHSIDKMNTQFDAIDKAEQISALCKYHGTFDQPCVVEKRFKIPETCDGCDMHCKINTVESSNRFKIQIGNNSIPELNFKNKFDALIKAFDLVKHCAHRKTK